MADETRMSNTEEGREEESDGAQLLTSDQVADQLERLLDGLAKEGVRVICFVLNFFLIFFWSKIYRPR